MAMEDAAHVHVRIEGFREPKQERSRRTLDRIVDATETLLSERGPGALTVQEVVARADASVGAFYSRFDSKEDAVSYVRERAWEESRRRWREFLAPDAWEDVPTPALIAEVVRRLCRVLLAGKRPTRAFYLDLLRREDEEGLARVRRLDRDVAALMARLLEERGVGPGVPANGRVAEEGFLRVISGLRDHLLLDPRGDERALILSLTRMYAALLGVEPPGSYRDLLATCADARRRRAPAPTERD